MQDAYKREGAAELVPDNCQWRAESPHLWRLNFPHLGGHGDQPLM